MIVLIIFMDAITLYKMAAVNDLVFHFFTARTDTLVCRHQEWRIAAWRHAAAFTLYLGYVT